MFEIERQLLHLKYPKLFEDALKKFLFEDNYKESIVNEYTLIKFFILSLPIL